MKIAHSDIKIDKVIDIHMSAFPGFFLTCLGRPFLRLLYAGFLDDPLGIFLVVKENGEIFGFAAGTSHPEIFFRKLLKRKWLSFVFASIPGFLRNPWFVTQKCVGALFYRGENPQDIPHAALLSSLAVSPSAGRRGLGQQLLKAFSDEAKKMGCKAVYLTTDESENDYVNRFYSKCGFELLDTFERPGKRMMNRWVRRFE